MLLRVTQKVVGVYCKVIIVINITVTVCLSPESRHISLQECGVTVAEVQSARKDFSIIRTNRNMRLHQKRKKMKKKRNRCTCNRRRKKKKRKDGGREGTDVYSGSSLI